MVHLDDEKTIKFNTCFMRKALDFPVLKENEEKALLKSWCLKKDQKALDKIIRAHLRQAISIALKFRNYNLPLGDLFQEAATGLLIAAKKFDISKKVRFSTYAGWWVRSSLQDYVLKNWSIVRTSTTAKQKKLFFTLKRLKLKLEKSLRADGLLSRKGQKELAKKMKITEKHIAYMDLRLSQHDHSLNMPISDQNQFGDVWQSLVEDKQKTPDHLIQQKHDRSYLHDVMSAALKKLNPVEKLIITKRWLTDKKTTLKILANNLHLSPERVRQIEQKSFVKIRRYMIRENIHL